MILEVKKPNSNYSTRQVQLFLIIWCHISNNSNSLNSRGILAHHVGLSISSITNNSTRKDWRTLKKLEEYIM